MAVNPIIAIVGRPNVGKSTLFNRLTKSRKAIVDAKPGITRDRIWGEGKWGDFVFNVIDTAGFDDQKDVIFEKIREQIDIAIEEADILFVVFDGKSELTQLDFKVAELLRKKQPQKVYFLANKIDSQAQSNSYFHLFELGISKFYPISAEQGKGIDDIFDDILLTTEKTDEFQADDIKYPKIAIVGKPNVGKSSLLNQFLQDNRALVDDKPGTTRDSIDSFFSLNDKKYILIDTAGIRRKTRVNTYVDNVSMIKSYKSIDQSDISILLIDGSNDISVLDAKIAGYIQQRGKGAIIAVNKSDLLKPEKFREIKNILSERLKFLDWAPLIFISALTGDGISKIFPEIEKIIKWQSYKAKTNDLNNYFREVLNKRTPPSKMKFKYIAQVAPKPPTFVIKTNYPVEVQDSYKRYIVNSIRKKYYFYGNPIFLTFKK